MAIFFLYWIFIFIGQDKSNIQLLCSFSGERVEVDAAQ